MLEVIEQVAKDEAFDLEKFDITSDESIFEKYKNEIPVLTINGRKAFKARATAAELKKKIGKARELASKLAADDEPMLELTDNVPVRPPRLIAAALIVATIGGFGYFVNEGLASARTGRQSLTAELLTIQPRDETPIPFALESLDGKKVSLDSLKDKIVFLNFWATWCPPCVEEMPSLKRLHEKIGGRDDFVMLLVSADESWEPVKKFFGDDKVPFTVLLDANGQIAKQYGTTKFPETFMVIDGRVRSFIMGPRDWDTWFARAYVESFFEGR